MQNSLQTRNSYGRYLTDIFSVYQQRTDLKMFLEIILSLITVAIFALFAIRPTLLTVTSLVKQIQEKEQTLAQMNTKIQNLNTAQNIITQNSLALGLLKQAIPEELAPEKYIQDLQDLAHRDGVTFKTASAKGINIKNSETKSTTAQIAFTVNGDYQNLLTFTKDISELLRANKIVTLAIEKPNAGEDLSGLNLSALTTIANEKN